MTPKECREIRKRLGLSASTVARLIGICRRSAAYAEAGRGRLVTAWRATHAMLEAASPDGGPEKFDRLDALLDAARPRARVKP